MPWGGGRGEEGGFPLNPMEGSSGSKPGCHGCPLSGGAAHRAPQHPSAPPPAPVPLILNQTPQYAPCQPAHLSEAQLPLENGEPQQTRYARRRTGSRGSMQRPRRLVSGCHAATVPRGLCAARRPGVPGHTDLTPHPPGCFRREAAGAHPASRNQLWFHFLLCHGVGGWQRGPAGQLRWAQRPGDSCSRHPSPALQAAAWGLGSRGTPLIPLHGHGGENPQEPRDLETGHHAGLDLALPQQGHLYLPALPCAKQGARGPSPCRERGLGPARTVGPRRQIQVPARGTQRGLA